MWPQILYAILFLIGIGIELERHGKKRKGKHNFWIALITSIIVQWILFKGGFWNPLL